jgi:protein-L-isoaspartate(D-aspartate) O-methyltransferase
MIGLENDLQPAVAAVCHIMNRFRIGIASILHSTNAVLVVLCGICCGAPLLPPQTAMAADDPYAAPRARMVDTIAGYARHLAAVPGRAELDPRVLKVMGTVPRHEFLPKGFAREAGLFYGLLPGSKSDHIAYADRPLPIGHGQTISQPFIVALMTDLAAPKSDHVVLEVGTGSGYQAAVLAQLVRRVCTIEIIPELGASAAATLKRLKYKNIKTSIGDGYHGWPDCGPFDSIVVTAAAGHVPPPLLRQLKPGGRLVIPVGGVFATQQLVLAQKAADGRVTTRQLLPVRFVPLVSKE